MVLPHSGHGNPPTAPTKGLGDQILKRLLWEISEKAPKDGAPYITLMADGPGRKLYQKNGFVETAPHSLGMVLKIASDVINEESEKSIQ